MDNAMQQRHSYVCPSLKLKLIKLNMCKGDSTYLKNVLHNVLLNSRLMSYDSINQYIENIRTFDP